MHSPSINVIRDGMELSWCGQAMGITVAHNEGLVKTSTIVNKILSHILTSSLGQQGVWHLSSCCSKDLILLIVIKIPTVYHKDRFGHTFDGWVANMTLSLSDSDCCIRKINRKRMGSIHTSLINVVTLRRGPSKDTVSSTFYNSNL